MRWIIFLFLCGTIFCYADEPPTLEYHEKENQEKLASDPQWLSFLHIPLPDRKSEVDDPKFFLSDSTDATKELLANIKQLTSNPTLRCQFPARYEWLAEKLDWQPKRVTPADCPKLFEWYQQLDTQKVSLIFPTAYMNSPSSMFGHLFLRLDAGKTANDLLAFSVNYGADVDSDDSSLTYVYKGLFGGYPGTYTTVPYYEKVKEYNDIEHRDIWEYPLQMDEQQIRRLLLHLWELQNVEIDYYFIDENCAYRILSLVAVVFPNLNLMEDFQTRAIPADVLKTSVKNNLVAQPDYRASLATQLLTQYSRLSPTEKSWVKKITEDTSQLDAVEFIKLPEYSKAMVYDTLNLWLRYELSDAGENISEANLGYKLLSARSRLKVKTEPSVDTPLSSPDNGHDAYRFAVGYQNTSNHNAITLNTRFAYHDLLDSTKGYLSGAQIEFLNIELSLAETTKINQVNVLSLKSLSPRNDLMSPLSWSFNLAGERLFRAEESSVFAQYLEGKLGATFGTDDNMFYGLFGVKILNISHESDQPSALAGVNIGWRVEYNSGQLLIDLQQQQDVDASVVELKKFDIGYQFNISTQSAFRFNWSRTAFNDYYNSQTQLNYLFYL